MFFGAMILWGLLAIRVESTMTGSIRYDDGAWRLEATEWSRAVVAYRRVAADGTVGDRQPITGLTPQRTRVVLDDFAAPERQRFDVILIFEADSLGRLLWRWVVR